MLYEYKLRLETITVEAVDRMNLVFDERSIAKNTVNHCLRKKTLNQKISPVEDRLQRRKAKS